MTIQLNGKPAETDGADNVDQLVTHLGLAPQAVLIEHNGVALHRREWSGRRIGDGDRVEVIRVVAGG